MLPAAMLAAVLALGGCANPHGIVGHVAPITPSRLGLSDAPAGASLVAADWWSAWGDPALAALVQAALTDNPSLQVAQARLLRAEASSDAVRAAQQPQVQGAVDLTRERFSATSIYPPPLGGSIRTLGNAQANASWELDLFGRNRAALDAALGAGRAAEADVQAARVLLASQVARSYVQLGRLQAQRELARSGLQQREDMLALIRQRVQAGLDTQVEQRQGEAPLPDARLQIEQLDEQIAATRHALCALAARDPGTLDTLQVDLDRLRPPALPASVPVDLLGRRADIVAARWRVEAAAGEVRSARAQFYPNINLVGFVGLASIGLDRLVRSDSEQYAAGPALRLPIFDAGRLRANLGGRTAELDAAIANYNATVVEAVHDAADPVSSLQSLQRQQAQQQSALGTAEAARALAVQRYKAGLTTQLVVLGSETGVLAQRRLAVDLLARTLDAQLQLTRALGGGYVAEASAPLPAPAPASAPVAFAP